MAMCSNVEIRIQFIAFNTNTGDKRNHIIDKKDGEGIFHLCSQILF